MSIQNPLSSISRGNDKRAIDELTQVVETFAGHRGNGQNKAVTIAELERIGLIKSTTSNGRVRRINLNKAVLFPDQVVETPVLPTGLIAVGGFTSIVLRWTAPDYQGHLGTNVYRSTENDFGTATLLDRPSSNFYSDNVDMGSTYYYWIRHINRAGAEGPLNDSTGTLGKTVFTTAKLLAELQGKIGQDQFVADLTSKIDLIDGEGGLSEHQAKVTALLEKYLNDFAVDGVPLEEKLTARFNLVKQAAEEAVSLADTTATNIIDSAIQLDFYNDKLDQLLIDEREFRNAILSINAENGEITIEAIEGLRSDFDQSLNQVYVEMDAKDSSIKLAAESYTRDWSQSNVIAKLNEAGIDISGENATVELFASSINFDGTTTVEDRLSEFNDAKIALSNAGIDIDGQNATVEISANNVSYIGGSMADYIGQMNSDLTTVEEKAISIEEDVVSLKSTVTTLDTIAPKYDPTKTYEVGDGVIHNFKLYVCSTKIEIPEPFNVSKWQLSGPINARVKELKVELDELDNTVRTIVGDIDFQEEVAKIAQAQEAIQSFNDELTSQAQYAVELFTASEVSNQAIIDEILSSDKQVDELKDTIYRFSFYDKSIQSISDDLKSEVSSRESAIAKFGDSLATLHKSFVVNANETGSKIKQVEQNQVEFNRNYAKKIEVSEQIANADYSQSTWFAQATANFVTPDGLTSFAKTTELTEAISSEAEARTTAIEQSSSQLGEDISAVEESVSTVVTESGNLQAQWGAKASVNDITAGIGIYNDGNKTRAAIHAMELVFLTDLSMSSIPYYSSSTTYYAGDLIKTGANTSRNVYMLLDDDNGKGRKLSSNSQLPVFGELLRTEHNEVDNPKYLFSPFKVEGDSVVMANLHALRGVFESIKVKGSSFLNGDIVGSSFTAVNGSDSTHISGSGEITMVRGGYTMLQNVGDFLIWYGKSAESGSPKISNAKWFLHKDGNYKREVSRVRKRATSSSNTFYARPSRDHFVVGGDIDLDLNLSLYLRDSSVDSRDADHSGTLTVEVRFLYSNNSSHILPSGTITKTIPYDGTSNSVGTPKDNFYEVSSRTVVSENILFNLTVPESHFIYGHSVPLQARVKITDNGNLLSEAIESSREATFSTIEVAN